MTHNEALSLNYREEVHHGTCTEHVGPRGGVTHHIETWRVNGAVKTWKREPNRLRIPIKHGVRDYAAIYEHNLPAFHRACDCPLHAR